MYRQPNRIETTMQSIFMCTPPTEASTISTSHPNLLHTSNTSAPHTPTRAPTSNARESTPHLLLPPRLYRSTSAFFKRPWSDADTAVSLPKSHSSIALSTYRSGGASDNANGHTTGSNYCKSPSWTSLSSCPTLVASSAELSRVSSVTTIALYFGGGGGGGGDPGGDDDDDDDDGDDDDDDDFDEGLEDLVVGEFPPGVAVWWGLIMMAMWFGVAVLFVAVVVVDLVGFLEEWMGRGVGG